MNSSFGLGVDLGVFRLDALGSLVEFFAAHGFAVLRGLYTSQELEALTAECAELQQAIVEGRIDARYGNAVLVDEAVGTGAFANYVQYVTEVSARARAAILKRQICELMAGWVPGGCLREHSRFGVVYQDARPGDGSAYKRIGWHSDWQSGPQLDVWPSVAVTLHLDDTSPANGFLRVVPGSHLWATPAPFKNVNNAVVPVGAKAVGGRTSAPPPYDMPLGFEKAAGEMALYCEAGDILFHDAYLWHSAAAATDDRAVRRHVRGAWFSGAPDAERTDHLEDFVKNAAR